jgi:fermentation-respiration switch protein FrsA (DUF1100 family)
MISFARGATRALFIAATCAVPLVASSSATAKPLGAPGTVVSVKPLKHSLWVPGAARGYKLTYVSTDQLPRRALSTGEMFLPKGKAPAGGWRLISWAHGTSGLADKCAPSNVGPAEPQRDFSYLHNWIKEGYAIVASDYVGLGTPLLPAYLGGRSEAHNIVDMVKAGRAFAAKQLPASDQLSKRWVVIGQSQGGGAAIYTARYATQFGGHGLDYLGAVGTGVPANVETILGGVGPTSNYSAGLTAYGAYILASLRYWYPSLHVDSILTPTGQHYLGVAQKLCIDPLDTAMNGVVVGKWLTGTLGSLPGWTKTIDSYMKMPERGFDKPFFMAHGLKDQDVPYALTKPYVDKLIANHQPVTFKTYNSDHSGTLLLSQKASHPFVRQLFAAAARRG